MSPKLPVVSGKQAAAALELIGFVTISQRGSHRKLRHPGGKVAIVPMHDELAYRDAEIDTAPSWH